MEAALIEIRDSQEAAWNEYAAGWKRWEAWTRMMLNPIGRRIVDALQLRGDEEVLDIATGAGEPGITIAKALHSGVVTAVDISENMLAVAAESARVEGTDNYDTLHADACELPFENNTFDALSCRHGFMFFPDMQLAADEAVRVLKPGGRLAISYWATPRRNAWAYGVMQTVHHHTRDRRERQHLFRCSPIGKMQHLFEQAGLRDIREERVNGTVQFGSPQSYWRHFTNVVMPVAKAIAATDEATQRAIRLEVMDMLEGYKHPHDGMYELPYEGIVLSGVK